MDLQLFLDGTFVYLGQLIPLSDALKSTLVFFSIDIFTAVSQAALLDDISNFRQWHHHFSFMCCELGRRVFLGDMYPFKQLPALSFEYQEFARLYERLIVLILVEPGLRPGLEPTILSKLHKSLSHNETIFQHARCIAFKMARTASNLASVDAFISAVCRVALELYGSPEHPIYE
jgi:hypothetical protein